MKSYKKYVTIFNVFYTCCNSTNLALRSTCSGLLAPTMTPVTPCCCSNHDNAACGMFKLFSSHTLWMSLIAWKIKYRSSQYNQYDQQQTFEWNIHVNSLATGRFKWNFRPASNFQAIDGWGISCEIALRWMPWDLTDVKSTLGQVMAWCRQAASHYLSQCWP